MSILGKNFLKILTVCIFLISEKALCDFTEQEMGLASGCLQAGICDGLVQCPRNRACFNACDIGFDPGATGRKLASYAATFFGMGHLKSAEPDYQVVCRGDCIVNLVSDCQKEQPIDITVTPPSKDPARSCREHCGSKGSLPSDPEKILYDMCERTCVNFDSLADCFNKNGAKILDLDPKTNKKLCDPEELGIIANPNSEFENNRANVQDKLRGLAREAICQIKGNDAEGCGATLCNNYPWARSCEQKQRALHQEMEKRKKEQQDGIIDYSEKALKELEQVIAARKRIEDANAKLDADIEKAAEEREAARAAKAEAKSAQSNQQQ